MVFKFRLESVLQHIELREDQSKQDLYQSRKLLGDAYVRLEALQESITQLEKEEFRKLDISYVLQQYSYKDRLKNEEVEQREIVGILKRECSEKEAKVVAIMKERKTLEKVRQKHFQDYNKQVSIIEQQHLDEQAIIAFRRAK